MQQHRFNIEAAMDYYFSNQHRFAAPVPKVDQQVLSKVFDKYAGDGDDKDCMFDEKMGQFFQDVGVDPESAGGLAVAYKLKCKPSL